MVHPSSQPPFLANIKLNQPIDSPLKSKALFHLFGGDSKTCKEYRHNYGGGTEFVPFFLMASLELHICEALILISDFVRSVFITNMIKFQLLSWKCIMKGYLGNVFLKSTYIYSEALSLTTIFFFNFFYENTSAS